MNRSLIALGLATSLFAASCSSTRYDDAQRVETVDIDFGSTDLQTLASGMVDGLIASPALQYIDHPGKENDKRVIFAFYEIENRTSEHIDTGGIKDLIEARMLESGMFRINNEGRSQDLIESQVRFQQGSGRVDPAMAKSFGTQIGADVVMFGTLRSIEKEGSRSLENFGTKTEDVYYQFALEAVNIQSGEIIWKKVEDLRKTKRTGLFGR